MFQERANKKTKWSIIVTVGLIAAIFYWVTAYRSITWWVGTSYTASAVSLGVNFPPGSLILTILGWPFSLLPLGISRALTMNLLAGLITAATLIITMISSLQIFRITTDAESADIKSRRYFLILSGAAIGCLIIGFSETVWTYSIQYTPYVLTALFTALILLAMLKWWHFTDKKAFFRLLFIIFLLVGLDFSVHRTNLLLLPGIIAWIFIRYPKTFLQLKSWSSSIAGLILGLAFHLITIPIAALKPVINANDPSNLSRFYDYISLKQYGGGWLVNLFPRKAPFLGGQLADYFHYFKSNLINIDGPLGIVIIFVPILVLLGIIILWRRNWKLCLGMIIQLLCLSLLAVFYFNTPGGFYWPMDRHYIPSYIIIAIFMAYALGSIFIYIWDKAGANRMVVISLLLLLVALIPFKQILSNYRACDGSKRHFAYDYAHNILNTLPENSILFIKGDNYWPLLYFNKLEKVRPDIIVISQNLINTQWFLRQILEENQSLPVQFTEEELSNFGPRRWHDTTIVMEIPATDSLFNLPPKTILPDTFRLSIKPTISNAAIMGQDWFMIKLLTEDKWLRPIYFDDPPGWLKYHCRLEGLVWRALPLDNPKINAENLWNNLFKIYSFRGYNDSDIPIDKFSRSVTESYYLSFLALLDHYFALYDKTTCEQILSRMNEVLPVGRVRPSAEILKAIESYKSALKGYD